MSVAQEKDPIILCCLQICKENHLLTQGILWKKGGCICQSDKQDARQDTASGLWSCRVQIFSRSSHVRSSEPEILFCL